MNRERAAPWLEGLALAAVVLLVLAFGGPVVRASYHGYLHATVGEAVLRDGLLPENPYHAGSPLRYYTLYPLLGVLLGRLGMGPLWGFAALNVLAAALFPPALDALGRALGLDYRARRGALLAVVLGFNGLGWLGFCCAESAPAGSPPVFALGALSWQGCFFAWDARLQAFLPKFLNVSSFALALPFALWAWVPVLREGRPLRALLPAGLCLAFNPLVGAYAGICMAVWLLPVLRRASMGRIAAWLGCGAGAVLLALPFLLPALSKGEDVSWIQVELGGHPLANLLGPLLLYLVPGYLGWSRWRAAGAWRWAFALGLAAGMLVVGDLPWDNEYKMARLAGLLWAVPAGAWFASGGRGRRRWGWALLLLCLPTSLAVVRAYWSWGSKAAALPLQESGGRLVPDPRGLGFELPAEILEVEAGAEPAAVLLVPPLEAGGGGVQGHPLAPLFHRSLLVDEVNVHNDRESDLPERRKLRSGFYGATDEVAAARLLRGLRDYVAERPLLVMAHDSQDGQRKALENAGATRLSPGAGLALWHLPPLR